MSEPTRFFLRSAARLVWRVCRVRDGCYVWCLGQRRTGTNEHQNPKSTSEDRM